MPRTAILYIAERCNQRCVFCLEEEGAWGEFVDPSTQQVYDLLRTLRERGAEHITFMGGETFFRKDLPRIISQAKAVGYTRIGVTTNGTVLSKAGFVQKLVDAGLDFVEVSVHGHTEELANGISRSAITYKRQRAALDEIQAVGTLFTIVNVVVCHENAHHLVDVVRYLESGWPGIPKRYKIKHVSLQGWALEQSEAGVSALGYEEVDYLALGDYLESAGAAFWFYNVPLCRLGRHASHSHELCSLATDERYFDLDHRGPSEYFDSGHQLEGRLWPKDSCGACAVRAVCCGVEESHRRARETLPLAPLAADPRALIEAALRERGLDASSAGARLAALAREPRPERFVQARADGALRFRCPDEEDPVDLLVELRVEGGRAFAETTRFALSYRASPERRNPPPEAPLYVLLEHALAALQAADARGVELDEARGLVGKLSAPGWRAEPAASAIPSRRKRELRVLAALQS